MTTVRSNGNSVFKARPKRVLVSIFVIFVIATYIIKPFLFVPAKTSSYPAPVNVRHTVLHVGHTVKEELGMGHRKNNFWTEEQMMALKRSIRNITRSVRIQADEDAKDVEHWITRLCAPEQKEPPLKKYQTPCWNSTDGLLCVPSLFTLQSDNSGLKDLYYRLTGHPHLEMTWGSEENFRPFPSQELPVRTNLLLYGVNMATKVGFHKQAKLVGYYPRFAWDFARQDASRPLLVDVRVRVQIMKKITPEAKFVILLRNPTVYTYLEICRPQFRPDPLPNCHSLIQKSVNDFKKAVTTATVASSRLVNSVRVPPTYILAIQPYLDVFPDSQIRIFTAEDYADPVKRLAILKEIFSFLDVPPLERLSLERLASMRGIEQSYRLWSIIEVPEPINSMLNDFYRPFNEELRLATGMNFSDWDSS